MPNPPMIIRTLRVPAELWEAAMEKARGRGESLSDVIREAIKRYVEL